MICGSEKAAVTMAIDIMMVMGVTITAVSMGMRKTIMRMTVMMQVMIIIKIW